MPTLCDLLYTRNWYYAYIHQAMQEYITNHPDFEGTPAGVQCKDIQDAAYRDFQGTK